MLKRLKKRFVAAAMISLTIVLAIIVIPINLLNYRSVTERADQILILIKENGGKFPQVLPEKPSDKFDFTLETPYETRYFSVTLEKNGTPTEIDTTSIAAVNDERAIKIAKTVLSMRHRVGYFGNYRYITEYHQDGASSSIFLDCTRSLETARTFSLLSIIICLGGLLLVFIILLVLSQRIVSPISESYEKQKRFITDAGHDIKTPITIIDADAELLEIELGEDNEWLSDIRKQTKRLASLTADLIFLSRMEEGEMENVIDFPLSDVAEDALRSFASLAITKKIELISNVSPGVSYLGNESSISKLITLLIDNAIKYSPEGECVNLTLKKTQKGIYLSVKNVAPDLTEESAKRMFERFYRSDSSRSSSGGFGIGLSVASAIVASHKGRISSTLVDKILTIEIIL